MTIYVNEEEPVQNIAINLANIGDLPYQFTIRSQSSHQDTVMVETQLVSTNNRYSMIQITFPDGFGDSHKNGVYYWSLKTGGLSLQEGLVKIITNPGGKINTLNYNSGVETEERVSDVFYRPQYT